MRAIFLTFVWGSAAFAQTFSNIATSTDLDHNSVRITASISQDGYVQTQCGTASGGPYTTVSSAPYPNSQKGGTGVIVTSLGGLDPNKQYYCIFAFGTSPTTIGSVNSQEFTFTTTAAVPHPVVPTLPAVWNPSSAANYPSFTTGYTHIRMVAGATGSSECVTYQGYGPIAYGGSTPGPTTSWSVSAGWTTQQVLDAVGYGVTLDYDEGVTCPIPNTADSYHTGYIFRERAIDPQASSIDDPAHRWIVIRTVQTNPAHFPPAGVRTGPEWDQYMVTFQSQQPNTDGSGASTCCTSGQHFVTDANNYSMPVHHYWVYDVHLTVNEGANQGPWYTFLEAGYANSPYNWANNPQYYVADRVHFDCSTLPIRCRGPAIMSTISGHFAATNNYVASFNNDDPNSVQTSSLGFYFTDCTGGPGMVDNNFLNAVGQNLYWESNSTDSCTPAGHLISVVDWTLTHNMLYWPISSLDTHYAGGNPQWDGYTRGAVRNQVEFKIGRRVKIDGNTIDGDWSAQNEGSAIFVSGINNPIILGSSGDFDFTITNNLIRHSANVFACMGVRPAANVGPPDNAVNRRILFTNNLAYQLGRGFYTVAGTNGGLLSAYVYNDPGCQDLTVMHNTFGYSSGDSGTPGFAYIPTPLAFGGNSVRSEGFAFQDNIAHFAIGQTGLAQTGIYYDSDPVDTCCSLYFPALPAIDPTNQLTLFQSFNTNYQWGRNVFIGSTNGNNSSTEPWPDITPSGLIAAKQYMPGVTGLSSSILADSYPTGTYMTDRQASAGLKNVASDDYTCTATGSTSSNPGNSCFAGVNHQQLESSLGIVSNIIVRQGPTAIQFNYLAPDSRGCSIDVSPDNTTWTRYSDTPTTRQRVLTVTGLTASTSYHYRLMCYYSQTPSYFSVPWDHSNLVTDGVTITTAATGTRTISLGGHGTSSVVLTDLLGTTYTQSCSSWPCTVTGVPNGWLQRTDTVTSGGTGTVWVK